MPSDLGATGDRPSLAPPRLAALSALALRPPAGLASIDRRDSGADRHHGERGTGSGAQRIRGELLKLGIVVSSRSIRRFRRRRPSRPPSQSWRAFLANHAGRSGPPTSSSSRPSPSRRSYVIFFISHGSRQLLHYEVPVPSSSLRRLRRGRAPLSPIIQALLLILA